MTIARPGARKGSPKKTTTKKGASRKSGPGIMGAKQRAADRKVDDKGKSAAAEKSRTFMDETRDEDRADAITKGIAAAVGIAKTGTKELRTTLELLEQTTEPKDSHFLLELARRVAGQVTQALQEEITKAKKATKAANLKW